MRHLSVKSRTYVIFAGLVVFVAVITFLVHLDLVFITKYWDYDPNYRPILFKGYDFSNENDPWIQVFAEYANRANAEHAHAGTKYLVCNLEGGLCNRMLHAISCLLYAIHHDLIVLYSWWYTATQYVPLTNEWVTLDDYDEIFQRPKNLKPFLLGRSEHTPECAWNVGTPKSLVYDLEDPIHRKVILNPFFIVPESIQCLHIRPHWNYWGATLIRNVRPYSKIPMEANLDTSFAVLARIMFQPKYKMSPSYLSRNFTLDKPLQCEWLLQHRSRWGFGRGTPSNQQLLQCAEIHGLKTANYNKTYFVSDQDHALLPSEDMKPSPVQYCRRKPHCDVDTVHMLYLLGIHCKKAVLTQMSTFGDCMAGLGPIPKQWKTNSKGTCKRKYELHPDEHAGDFIKGI